MSVKIEGGANVTFANTNVGDHATMNVNQAVDVRRQLDELLAAIQAHREELPDEVAREAEAARAELSEPMPRTDRVATAVARIREGAASVTAVAGAAAAVLRTLGML